MRHRKQSGVSGAIARLRREEGWNWLKRKLGLTKN
jgi:hypothetical protein